MEKLQNLTAVFETVGEKAEEEVGLLIDASLSISLLETDIVSKKELFEKIGKKTILTRLAVSGDQNGECFLSHDLKDAVLLAGTLVMLPANELEQRVAKDVFGEEENDAFGEIANIITGALSTSFEEEYQGALHFIKKSLEPLIKTKLDPASDAPFPAQRFFLSAFSFQKEGKDLQPFYIIIPVGLLGLEEAVAPAVEEAPPGKTVAKTGQEKKPAEKTALQTAENDAPGLQPGTKPAEEDEKEVILILSDSTENSQAFVESLEPRNCDCICKGFHEDIKEIFQTKRVRGVFLVMKEVNDQGFATVIKIKSSAPARIPVITAGPKWTRSTVLQAIKYGSCDVLMTPATAEEIQEKAQRHMFSAPV